MLKCQNMNAIVYAHLYLTHGGSLSRLENGIDLFITETRCGQGAAEMLEEFGILFLPVAD